MPHFRFAARTSGRRRGEKYGDRNRQSFRRRGRRFFRSFLRNRRSFLISSLPIAADDVRCRESGRTTRRTLEQIDLSPRSRVLLEADSSKYQNIPEILFEYLSSDITHLVGDVELKIAGGQGIFLFPFSFFSPLSFFANFANASRTARVE